MSKKTTDMIKSLSSKELGIDKLARILAGGTICSAAAIVGNELWIAGNGVSYRQDKNNNARSYIETINDYFSDLSQGKITSDDMRENAIKASCNIARFNMGKKGFGVDEEKMNESAQQNKWMAKTNSHCQR